MTRTTEFEKFSEEKDMKITYKQEKRLEGKYFKIVQHDIDRDEIYLSPAGSGEYLTKSQLQELGKAIEEFLK